MDLHQFIVSSFCKFHYSTIFNKYSIYQNKERNLSHIIGTLIMLVYGLLVGYCVQHDVQCNLFYYIKRRVDLSMFIW